METSLVSLYFGQNTAAQLLCKLSPGSEPGMSWYNESCLFRRCVGLRAESFLRPSQPLPPAPAPASTRWVLLERVPSSTPSGGSGEPGDASAHGTAHIGSIPPLPAVTQACLSCQALACIMSEALCPVPLPVPCRPRLPCGCFLEMV